MVVYSADQGRGTLSLVTASNIGKLFTSTRCLDLCKDLLVTPLLTKAQAMVQCECLLKRLHDQSQRQYPCPASTRNRTRVARITVIVCVSFKISFVDI